MSIYQYIDGASQQRANRPKRITIMSTRKNEQEIEKGAT